MRFGTAILVSATETAIVMAADRLLQWKSGETGETFKRATGSKAFKVSNKFFVGTSGLQPSDTQDSVGNIAPLLLGGAPYVLSDVLHPAENFQSPEALADEIRSKAERRFSECDLTFALSQSEEHRTAITYFVAGIRQADARPVAYSIRVEVAPDGHTVVGPVRNRLDQPTGFLMTGQTVAIQAALAGDKGLLERAGRIMGGLQSGFPGLGLSAETNTAMQEAAALVFLQAEETPGKVGGGVDVLAIEKGLEELVHHRFEPPVGRTSAGSPAPEAGK